MPARKKDEKPESVEERAVDVPEKAEPLGPKDPVEVPSIMGSTFAERAAANKALAKKRTEAKG